jgi:hypothetical protein
MEQGFREIFHPGLEVDSVRSPCGSPINPNIVIVDIPQLISAYEGIEVGREKESETL